MEARDFLVKPVKNYKNLNDEFLIALGRSKENIASFTKHESGCLKRTTTIN